MTPRLRTIALAPVLLALMGSVFVTGCAMAPPAATVSTEKLPFADAIRVAVDGVLRQVAPPSGLLARRERRTVVLDPALDAGTGQQTHATLQLDKAVSAALAQSSAALDVRPFDAASLAKADYLLTGTLQRSQSAFSINLALVDVKAGTVAAQSSAAARSEGVDMQPLALLIEQASFLIAGVLLWSAVLGTRLGGATDRRASGVAALLLTSMHMTLLGALIGLAPRALYAMMEMHPAIHGLDALEDQQIGGVVMLMVGAASYFIGGLAMLGGLLKTRSATA